MKVSTIFRHPVRFTRSRYFTVDYDVYRMSTCVHFSHFSFTTEMDSPLIFNFAFPLRGFHVYKELWNPRLNEKLDTVLNTLIRRKVSACEVAKIK